MTTTTLTRLISAALIGQRLDWRWSDGDHSAYASIASGMGGLTVRVSDHCQVIGGGWDEGRGERRGAAAVSISPAADGWLAVIAGDSDRPLRIALPAEPSTDEIWDMFRAAWRRVVI